MKKMTELSEQELVKILEQWAEAYYNDQPLVEDKIYDQYFDYLKEKYSNNPYLIKIGIAPPRNTPWNKEDHIIPMSSLDKVNTIEQLEKWVSSLKYLNPSTNLQKEVTEFWLAEKLDGFSIELIYYKGLFKQAITRGDGVSGEDISENIKLIKTLPKNLKVNFNGAIRGEVILYKSLFTSLQLKKEDGELYNNPRNAAAGIARRFDHKYAEHLNILCYDIISFDKHSFPSESIKISTLKKLGFPTLDGEKVSLEKAKENFQEYVDYKRAQLDYDIDGLVIKVNDQVAVDQLESKDRENKNPKTQRAWKFDSEGKVSILREIIFSLGRSGAITPIAKIDSVKLAGANVELASLHNISIMEKLNANIGDSVFVIRSNDVIPQIVRVEKKRNLKPIILPTNCPDCNTKLKLEITKRKNDEVKILICPNSENCPTQQIGRISKFVECLEIRDFNESRIEILFKNGLIKKIEDLFTFNRQEALNLEGFGKRLLEKLDEQLFNLKNIPLEKVLGGLGISSLGVRQWKKITNAGYKSWEDFDQLIQLDKSTFLEKLKSIKGLGNELISQMYDGLKNYFITYEALRNHINLSGTIKGKLMGLSFCMTGLRTWNNESIEDIVEKNGGEIKNSVSKNLNYLIVADKNTGSTKAKKAQALGIPIITMEELLQML